MSERNEINRSDRPDHEGPREQGPHREAWRLEFAEHLADPSGSPEDRCLDAIWRATTPADPGEPAWRAVWARIQAVPEPILRHPVRRWQPVVWVVGFLSASAAAVWFLLAHGLGGNLQPAPPVPDPSQPPPQQVKVDPRPNQDLEPFAVARSDEVVILSIAGADTDKLPVGRLPVTEDREWIPVTREELRITQMGPTADGGVPVVRGNNPVIWAPLHNEGDEPNP